MLGIAATVSLAVTLVHDDGAFAATRSPALDEVATAATTDSTTAIAELDQRLTAAQGDVDTATAGLSEIDRKIAALRVTLAQYQSTVATLKQKVTEQAITTYVRGSDANLLATTAANDVNAAAANRATLDAVAGDIRAAAADLQAAKAALTTLVADLQAAEIERSNAVAVLNQRTALLDRERSEQARLVDQIEQVLDDTLAEIDSMTSSGDPLAKQIDDLLADAQQRAVKAEAVKTAQAMRATRSTATGRIVSVRGIHVDASLAGSLEAMMAAAATDGIALGGSGWRDQNEQIQRRRENCGTSDYAIWDMPAEQCSPVTARPGRSLHERGLAIDFTANRFVISRSSAAFKWLAANAANYGFYNLPSEPWHWSIDAN
jgi:LAS superfamily LD-carboxypeptidase LdcB